MAAAAAATHDLRTVVYSDERLDEEWRRLDKSLTVSFILLFGQTNIAHAFGLGLDSEEDIQRLVTPKVKTVFITTKSEHPLYGYKETFTEHYLPNYTRDEPRLEKFYPSLVQSKAADSTFTAPFRRNYGSVPIPLSTFLIRFFLGFTSEGQMGKDTPTIYPRIKLQFEIPSLKDDAHKDFDGSILSDTKENESKRQVVEYFAYFKAVFLKELLESNNSGVEFTVTIPNTKSAFTSNSAWIIEKWSTPPKFTIVEPRQKRYTKTRVLLNRLTTAPTDGGGGAGAGATGGARRRTARRRHRARRNKSRRAK